PVTVTGAGWQTSALGTWVRGGFGVPGLHLPLVNKEAVEVVVWSPTPEVAGLASDQPYLLAYDAAALRRGAARRRGGGRPRAAGPAAAGGRGRGDAGHHRPAARAAGPRRAGHVRAARQHPAQGGAERRLHQQRPGPADRRLLPARPPARPADITARRAG